MKKSLIAIAALAAVGAASAQSSVTLFGIVDVGVAHISNKDGARVTGLSNSGGGAGNRIGFRGVEDLGGGLKAGFWLEAGINTDSGAGASNPSTDNLTASTVSGSLQFGRRSTVSLLGNFGEARLGRDYTPAYLSETAFDPFGNNGIGAAAWYQVNLIGQSRLRASNQISYILPSLGGLYGQVSYAIGENASNVGVTKDDGRTVGARIGYANGPFDVALAGNKLTQTLVGGQSNDKTHANIAGSFDFGVAKLFALYDLQKADNAPINGETKVTGGLIGVTAPVGPGLIKAAYSVVETKVTGAGLKPESKKFAIGYDYNFSKRTRLYATLARSSNSEGSNLSVGAVGVGGLTVPAAVANKASNGYEIGLRHTF